MMPGKKKLKSSNDGDNFEIESCSERKDKQSMTNRSFLLIEVVVVR